MSGVDLAAVAALGALHGVNPAMGWLFAVAIGLQERSRRALVEALGPIAIGHATSVLLAILVIEGTSSFVTDTTLRLAGGGLLAAFALWKLLARRAHPRWVGMRLSRRDLAAWSFLMSTAHGAGLMLLPLLAGSGLRLDGSGDVPRGLDAALVATSVHTAAMLIVAGVVAVTVFEVVGVGILRRAWVNLDRVWAGALLIAAAGTLFAA